MQKLRAELAETKRRLDVYETRDADTERTTALQAAGMGDAAMEDALRLFRPQRAGEWWILGNSSGMSLPKLAQRFVDERPHLRGQSSAHEVAYANVAPGFEPPRYADGRLVPQDQWSMDELMQAAGDWPGKQEPKLDPIRAADIARECPAAC